MLFLKFVSSHLPPCSLITYFFTGLFAFHCQFFFLFLWHSLNLGHLFQADAGGSPSLVARGLATTQAAGAADHIEIQVPNEKVIAFSFILPYMYLHKHVQRCSCIVTPVQAFIKFS